jgi:hypothetical protein
VFLWPISQTPFSLGSNGTPHEAVLEITPRGAAFTLAALSHVGHAAHLALVDAYLKGQVRLTETAGIGQDSRTVAASLATPLVAAAELGVERLTLADLILLPRDLTGGESSDRSANSQPTRSPDCARLLLRADDTWHWIRGAERFEQPGCLGTRRVGVGEPWHDVIVEVPYTAQLEASVRVSRWPAPLTAEVRAPTTSTDTPDASIVAGLRVLALTRFGRASLLSKQAADSIVAAASDRPLAVSITDIRAEAADAARQPMMCLKAAADADGVVSRLAAPIRERRPALTALVWHGRTIEVSLTPDPDGYQTLCLLPPADAGLGDIVLTMLAATRSVIEALIGRPLAEQRSDPIALTLQSDQDGQARTTTLAIGESIVIVRNQVVFTAWIGSDGRAMLKLFPPGGMS